MEQRSNGSRLATLLIVYLVLILAPVGGMLLIFNFMRNRGGDVIEQELELEVASLLSALSKTEFTGTEIGPMMALAHNDETRQIVAKGPKVVPILVRRLRDSGVHESTYIVFCLTELKAKEATEVIRLLQKKILEGRWLRRNSTLELQVRVFLTRADTW